MSPILKQNRTFRICLRPQITSLLPALQNSVKVSVLALLLLTLQPLCSFDQLHSHSHHSTVLSCLLANINSQVSYKWSLLLPTGQLSRFLLDTLFKLHWFLRPCPHHSSIPPASLLFLHFAQWSSPPDVGCVHSFFLWLGHEV